MWAMSPLVAFAACVLAAPPPQVAPVDLDLALARETLARRRFAALTPKTPKTWRRAFVEHFAGTRWAARAELPAVLNGDGDAAAFRARYPDFPALHIPLGRFRRAKTSGDKPLAASLRAYSVARARAPEADATFAAALSLLERLPPGRRLIQLCDRDLMRSLRVRTRPKQAIRVAEACGTALERAGLLDAAVRYAFELGRSAWDLEPALAKDGLRRVAQLCPRCPEAPGAAWLLALLEGRATLWTAPGSRANGRLDTSAVTASRTFRLDGPKSVDGVTLTLSAPAHFLVTLLGAAGQPLSRFERDPGTSEAFDTPKRRLLTRADIAREAASRYRPASWRSSAADSTCWATF